MDSKSISFSAFEIGSDRSGSSQRADLPVLCEELTPSDPPEYAVVPQASAPRRGAWSADDHVDSSLDRFAARVDPSGWMCATDSVRAQLESVIHGRPPPPRSSSSRFQTLKLAASAKAAERPSVPAPATVFMPAQQAPIAATSSTADAAPAPSVGDLDTPARPLRASTHETAVADSMRVRMADKAARAGQVARAMLDRQEQQFARLDAERAKQIEQLTHRAEAAEAKVRALEMHIAAEQQLASVLGRRFGQKPYEVFPAFVARLGMTAKAGVHRGTRAASSPLGSRDAVETSAQG